MVKIGEISVDQLNDQSRAIDIYERVLEQEPEHTRALSALARLYEAQGDWDKVAEVLNKAANTGRSGSDAAEVIGEISFLYHLVPEVYFKLNKLVILDKSSKAKLTAYIFFVDKGKK
jgi:lipopolysaccharide biosynthesis regulator YciM